MDEVRGSSPLRSTISSEIEKIRVVPRKNLSSREDERFFDYCCNFYYTWTGRLRRPKGKTEFFGDTPNPGKGLRPLHSQMSQGERNNVSSASLGEKCLYDYAHEVQS
jgi:hypothetical protein